MKNGHWMTAKDVLRVNAFKWPTKIGIKDLYKLGRLAFSINPDQVKNITIPITNGQCLGLGGGAQQLFADFRDDGVVETAG